MPLNGDDPIHQDALGHASRCFARARGGGNAGSEDSSTALLDIEAAALVDAAWRAADLARDDWRVLEMREQAQRRRSRRRLRRTALWVLSGASAAAAAAFLMLPNPYGQKPSADQLVQGTVSKQRFSTVIGEFTTIALSDGSSVILDADSSLETQFDKGTRRIKLLRGRALFRVAHEIRPFIVEGQLFSVRAVGTAFEVDSDDQSQELTMLEGTVVASGNRAGRELRLNAGKNLEVTEGGDWSVSHVDLQQAGSWTRGELVFTDEPISHIVERINRYSARRVIVDDTVGSYRLSAVLRAGDPVALVSAIVGLGIAEEPDWNQGEIVIHKKI